MGKVYTLSVRQTNKCMLMTVKDYNLKIHDQKKTRVMQVP